MLPAGGKRVDTCGFYPLNSRFPLFLSLAQTRDRRPLRNRGTAEDFFYRRGAQCAPMSRPIRSAGYHTAAQTVYSAQARHICAAQLVYALLWTTPADSTLPTNFTAGGAKVNCRRAREGALGYDLGAPFVNHLHTPNRRGAQCAPRKCLILRCVGANVCHSLDTVYLHHNIKTEKHDKSLRQFSILHFQFSITPQNAKKGPKGVLFCVHKTLT